MAITCGLDVGLILIFAGLMNIGTGWIFRQPIPVQPMKALAAVAITERLAGPEIAAAGLIMGLALVLLASGGAADWAGRQIPKAVVRGIQAGIGVKLALTGVAWLSGLDIASLRLLPAGPLAPIGLDSITTAAVVAALLLMPKLRRFPVLLAIFLLGFALMYLADPSIYEGLRLSLPQFGVFLPDHWKHWQGGLVRGAVPQMPLTLLNSVVAVCALSADYFPGRGISPRRMTASVGLMNLLCVPFGGIPMCHGSGGLAAQYRFGARTGPSVIMLGVLKVAAGLLFGAALASLLSAYPRSILAVMLILAGFTLASAARDALRGANLLVLFTTAAPILLINTTAGFVTGLLVALALSLRREPAL